MQQPTAEEKERFLEYVRGGDDRATAAWKINPEYTGTMFRRLCEPLSHKSYDPEFALAYTKAVEERGPLDPSRQRIWQHGQRPSNTSSSLTSNGYTKAPHLSAEQLEQFLELIRDGEPAVSAARQLDPQTSVTQIHRRAAKDMEFARAFREAKEEGYSTYKDRLRAEATRQAFAGDYRALRDQMIMHLEEAGVLTTSKHEIGGLDGGAIRVFAEKYFSELPTEMMDEMIRLVEQRELGQIGPASDG